MKALRAGGTCSAAAQWLLLAVGFSTFWFHKPPDALAMSGMALIIAAGVYLARGR